MTTVKEIFEPVPLLGLLVLFFVCPLHTPAHGDLHEQIANLSDRIENSSEDSNLYIQRGELYRIHKDWEKGLQDFNNALRSGADKSQIDYLKGRLYYESGDFEEARQVLGRSLSQSPDNQQARLYLARSLAAQGEVERASQIYELALGKMNKPKPDYYVEWAQMLASDQDPKCDRAINVLDDAIKRVGPLITLNTTALQIEIQCNRYDDALRRVDNIMEKSQRKERWLTKRGEILEKAGRQTEAANSYKDALQAIASLPERHRKVDKVKQWETQCQEGLERLSQKHSIK